jgi:hypothetical protein
MFFIIPYLNAEQLIHETAAEISEDDIRNSSAVKHIQREQLFGLVMLEFTRVQSLQTK